MNKSHFRIVFVIAGVLVVSSAIAVALMLWQLREDAIAEGLRNSDGVADRPQNICTVFFLESHSVF